MNNSYQAKNGFKTFLVTLVISLGVFGAVYYLTSYPSYEMDIEESTGGRSLDKEENTEDKKVGMVTEEQVLGETSSPFEELNEKEYDVPRRTVLAGADTPTADLNEGAALETTESTVPDTGTLGMTASLLVSLTILSAGLYYIHLDPHELALQNFEDRFRI